MLTSKATHQVVSISTKHRRDHTGIYAIDVQDASSAQRLTLQQVINSIDNNEATFIVMGRDHSRSTVGVVRPRNGPAYIRSHADGNPNDNLLALPESPERR